MARLNPARLPTCCSFPATRSIPRAACGERSSMGERPMRTERFWLALALATVCVGFSVSAQDGKKPETKDAKDAKSAKETKKPVPAIALVGGDVYTVTKGVVRNGTVVIENGKI